MLLNIKFKKTLLSIGLITILHTQIFAQLDGRRFRFGIVGKSGFSWNQSTSPRVENSGIGYLVAYGIQMEHYRSDIFGMSIGISDNHTRNRLSYIDGLEYRYTFQNSTGNTVSKNVPINERSIYLRSVNIPIKIKAKTPEIGFFTYFLEVGLDNDLITKSESVKISIKDNGSLRTLEGDEARIEASNETSWYRGGALFGVGTEYNLVGSVSLLLSVNYSMPFTRTLRKESREIFWADNNNALNQEVQTHRLFLKAGLLF